MEIVEDLQSNQEEADTRMLLHAQHASSTHEQVVLSTPDTDVFIIALSKLHKINAKLFMLTGVGEKRRLINLREVGERAVNQLNNNNCSNEMFLEALLGFHSFTGCDATSAFFGRRKASPLNILSTDDEYIRVSRALSYCEDLSQHHKRIIESFVCHMYGKKDGHTQGIMVNDLRYHIYCQKEGKVSCKQLPPCLNVLEQHLKRAHYQARIWNSCLQQEACIDAPQENGWTINDGKLDTEWMTCEAAPEEVNIFFYL